MYGQVEDSLELRLDSLRGPDELRYEVFRDGTS
jgi:hypothetical protein